MKYSVWHGYWKLLTDNGYLVIQCQNEREAFAVRRALSNIKRRNPKLNNRTMRLASRELKKDDGSVEVHFWLHEQGVPPKLFFLE